MYPEQLSTMTCIHGCQEGRPSQQQEHDSLSAASGLETIDAPHTRHGQRRTLIHPDPGPVLSAAPVLAGFDIAAASHPVQAPGGDYFGFLRLSDADLAIAIGDASGHGPEAARLMARTSAQLRTFARAEVEPARILTGVNRRLVRDAVLGDSFVTLLLARLRPPLRSLAYASAGHATGYIFDPAGAVRSRLRSTGLPLGVDATLDISAGPTTILQPGEIVLLMTDGVVEAESPGATAFGTERVLNVVRANRGRRARTILDTLYGAVHAFAHEGRPRDDITVVVIKVEPG